MMTDWLSNIEYLCERDSKINAQRPVINPHGALRMARVIRELAEKLEACMSITGVVPNLSDDAKDVVASKQ